MGGVCPESENVNGGRLLPTLAKKQLQEAAVAKPSPEKESFVIHESSIQGTEGQPVWPQSDWSGREDRNLSLLASPSFWTLRGKLGLRASNQDSWADPDSFEVNQPKREKGDCEGRDQVEPKAQMIFQLPFSPLPGMASILS